MSTLFSEISIRNIRIKNRIVFPPMACFSYSGEDGHVTEKNISHYEARAKGGTGLIIVETTSVSKNGRLSTAQLGIWSENHVEGLQQITEACHRFGSRVLVQIDHAGLIAQKAITDDPVAPSEYHDISPSGREMSARALTIEEIQAIKRDFAAAALRAKKAGFDGVELHGVHGHLISQFMSPLVNRRNDLYGGTIANRARFAVEVVAAIREKTGNEFIIGCRMACNEYDLNSGIEIARELEKAGVDLLHVSTGFGVPVNIESDNLPPVPQGFRFNWIVYSGTEIKKNVKVPVIVVNGIREPEQARDLVENDMADFVAIGKGMLIDSEWANKAQQNQDVIACLGCKPCAIFTPKDVCPLINSRI